MKSNFAGVNNKHNITSTFAQDENITCPKCRHFYDDSSNNNSDDTGTARLPVLLMPCGCTCCRPCIRNFSHHASSSGSNSSGGPAQPHCPRCHRRIEVTRFDENAMALVQAAQAQIRASSSYGQPQQQQHHHHHPQQYHEQQQYEARNFDLSSDAAGSYSAAATSLMGPLNPAVREQLMRMCRTPEDRANAEQIARAVHHLRRSIDSTKLDFDLAAQERNAAVDAAEAKGSVVSTLQTELSDLDEKLHQLQLDRQVILLQLQSAIEEKSGASRYRVECDLRMLELQKRLQMQAEMLEQRAAVVQRLAPGIQLL